MLTERRFERSHGIRVERNAATLTRFRRAVIEPCDLADEIDAAPFEPEDLTRAAAGRECEPHDGLHVLG